MKLLVHGHQIKVFPPPLLLRFALTVQITVTLKAYTEYHLQI